MRESMPWISRSNISCVRVRVRVRVRVGLGLGTGFERVDAVDLTVQHILR